MSRTRHHHSKPRVKLLKLPDRYTGWVGEGCNSQQARKFIKRLQHRAWRRANKLHEEEPQ